MVLASEVVTTSFVIAHTVLKLVATLSCQVDNLHPQPDKDVREMGAIFVAIYAVGIASCNLADTEIVITSPTASVGIV